MTKGSKQSAFTLIELLVVISIIALLMSISMPTLRRVRQQARMVACNSNLRQWGILFHTYSAENDGEFFTGVNQKGFWWLSQLDAKVRDWEANKIWFCPNAHKPLFDQTGNRVGTWNITDAWGIHLDAGQGITFGPKGITGSYGVNGYFIRIPRNSTYQGGVPARDGWARLDAVKQPTRVPLYLDALRFDLWPRPTDPPASYEFAAWTTNNHMARVCINRHFGTVGSAFADGSTRNVGLKELWKLKWHRSFNTNGPWTQAGGVQPRHWPDWIRPYPDY